MSKKKTSNAASTVKFPGIAVVLGGDEYIVPPMAIGKLEVMLDRLQKFSGGIDAESTNTVLDASHAALVRNYPDITREELGELIDVGNMHEVMGAVMDVAGLRRKEAEKQSSAPEVAGDAAPLTSASSTATSAPASDGPGSTSEKT